MVNSTKNFSLNTDSFCLVQEKMKQKVKNFFIGIKNYNKVIVERLEIEIENIDLLLWLNNQKSNEKIFWQNRENTFKVAGIHSAYSIITQNENTLHSSIQRISELCLQSKIRFYGGMRFDIKSNPDLLWNNFGTSHFFLPQFEITNQKNQTVFATNLIYLPGQNLEKSEKELIQKLETVNFFPEELPFFINNINQRIDVPSFENWQKMFQSVKNIFLTKNVDKIVLARKSSFSFPLWINGLSLLNQLMEQQDNAYYFYFQLEPDKAFLGAPPERLYSRKNQSIFSEALAGTRIRDRDPQKDYKLGQELLQSNKDIHEHALVIENIHEVFQDICVQHKYNKQPKLLKLQNLQHLYCPFTGTLKEHMSDSQILSQLHPTAAVCGYPKKRNIDYISEIESFDRGWFAGPIGWIAQNEAEFAVAIRSSVVDKQQVHTFAGAGIVSQSNDHDEWNEIENKMKNLTRFFSNEPKTL